MTTTTDRFVFFWNPPDPLSQWTPSTFKVDDVRYVNAEQFMMAEKARLFDDQESLARILATTSPREHKSLGRAVRGFDQEKWAAHRETVVVRGNLAKFSQDQDLQRELCKSGERVLVEASPFDQIWGIGLAADDPRAQDPAKWRGQNLLGIALMRVREQLCGRP